MRFQNWFLGLALLALPTMAWGQAKPIEIAPEHRVQNDRHPGVCWWACAEMIGRQYGMKPLVGLVAQVKKTGIGHVGGAKPTDIAYWNGKLGLAMDYSPAGKTQEAAAWLRTKLDAGTPVIAGVWENGGMHAVLVTHLTPEPVVYTNAEGHVTKDFVVHYIDPNQAAKTYSRSWADFWSRYYGQSWAYNVTPPAKAQEPRGAPDRPKSGVPGGGTGHSGPQVKVVDPRILARIPVQNTQFTQIHIPTHLGVLGLRIDPKGGHPLVTGIVPSNQDLKDGIARPLDTIENNAFGEYYLNGYDYYAEYRERLRRGEIKLPGGSK